MKSLFVALLVLFVSSSFAIHGVYRQCDFNTGDETLFEIFAPGPPFQSKTTFLFGGCLDGLVQYEVVAEFEFEFESDREDGGSNVAFHYRSAMATAHTDDAVDALQNKCGTRFRKEVPQNVLGCLFCPTRYDIYLRLEDDVFILGDGIACNAADRPTQYEESKYVLVEQNEEPVTGSEFSVTYTASGSFSYVNVDDDAEDDFYPDEDDENLFNDDDDDVPLTTDFSTFTYTVYNTLSNPSPSSGVAALSIAIGAILLSIFALI